MSQNNQLKKANEALAVMFPNNEEPFCAKCGERVSVHGGNVMLHGELTDDVEWHYQCECGHRETIA